jgi:hypothetical protein
MKLIAFDLETRKIQPGILAPPIVCGAWALPASPVDAWLEKPAELGETFAKFARAGYTFCGANIAYDMGCVAAHYPGMLPIVFDLYDQGRVFDVLISEKLYAIGLGCLNLHPVDMSPLTSYNLESVARIHGVPNAKANDAWVLRYHELEQLPFDQWPAEAAQYPIDDVCSTLTAAQAQIDRGLSVGLAANDHNLADQVRTAWALHLGAIWGLLVDQNYTAAYLADVTARRAALIGKLTGAGFYRADGTKDSVALKRAVAVAYGDGDVCPTCTGGGLTVVEARFGKKGQRIKDEPAKKCPTCAGVGLSDNQRIPKTAKGSISTARDTLVESGDDTLLELAAYSELDRAVSSYIPYLQSAGDHPLTLHANNPLASGRVSYKGLIQLMPKDGPERECIHPRPGHVFFSVDYEGLELVTHAQNCLWTVGHSALAEALNAGKKPHNMLAATLAQQSDLAFDLLYAQRDKRSISLRSSAKPANFGFPGGMGPVMLALQQRNQGPDTTGPDGRVYRGLRFCLLLGYAEQCGATKIYEYRGRPCAPVCFDCVEACVDLRKAWFERWVENEAYFAYVGREIEQRGYLKQHVSNRIRGRVEFCDGANTLFQGLAADGATRALYEVVRDQYTNPRSPLFGSRTIVFAHDELIGEAPIETAHEVVTAVADKMVEVMQRYTPDVKVRAERTLMSRWYKQASLIFDEHNRVAVWSPP